MTSERDQQALLQALRSEEKDESVQNPKNIRKTNKSQKNNSLEMMSYATTPQTSSLLEPWADLLDDAILQDQLERQPATLAPKIPTMDDLEETLDLDAILNAQPRKPEDDTGSKALLWTLEDLKRHFTTIVEREDRQIRNANRTWTSRTNGALTQDNRSKMIALINDLSAGFSLCYLSPELVYHLAVTYLDLYFRAMTPTPGQHTIYSEKTIAIALFAVAFSMESEVDPSLQQFIKRVETFRTGIALSNTELQVLLKEVKRHIVDQQILMDCNGYQTSPQEFLNHAFHIANQVKSDIRDADIINFATWTGITPTFRRLANVDTANRLLATCVIMEDSLRFRPSLLAATVFFVSCPLVSGYMGADDKLMRIATGYSREEVEGSACFGFVTTVKLTAGLEDFELEDQQQRNIPRETNRTDQVLKLWTRGLVENIDMEWWLMQRPTLELPKEEEAMVLYSRIDKKRTLGVSEDDEELVSMTRRMRELEADLDDFDNDGLDDEGLPDWIPDLDDSFDNDGLNDEGLPDWIPDLDGLGGMVTVDTDDAATINNTKDTDDSATINTKDKDDTATINTKDTDDTATINTDKDDTTGEKHGPAPPRKRAPRRPRAPTFPAWRRIGKRLERI
ncbi:uncharacterized protein EV422DRAFT_545157 [Fimicolochytrium jonesii]|uniref:uncharacterized protein n=1 Tax=Fimicolochytrium jonesii TaxID=1396493 RepID=UPI0022FE408F|nr:uncharacterized protein EV422DRAFT_545157 [Fimicolochytrium jonesii]KAI8816648.1 hypothetical protein EV422DRAFT_545157 [Fimicolochytrium jonesii]